MKIFFQKTRQTHRKKRSRQNVKTSGKKEITDGFDSHKITVKADENQTPVENEMPTEEIAEKVATLLQNVFGLSKEDVEDLLEQLGIAPDGSDRGCYRCTTVNRRQVTLRRSMHSFWRCMVWKIPVQCLYRMNLLPIGCRSHRGFLKFWEQVSEVPQDSQDMQNFLQNLTEVITENKNVPEQTQKQTDVEADSVTDTSAVTVSQDESVPVTVEVSNESGQSDAFAQDSQTGSQPAAEAENSLPAFVDRLTQAFEPVWRNTEIRQVSMQEIVDQVVNHIRIRVLPQTTSMELQLNRNLSDVCI